MENRNRIIVLLILYITTNFMGTAIHGQSKTGLKVGANFTNLYVDNVDDENMKIGFTGGLYHRESISHHFAIQPEILFSQKGSAIQYNNFLSGSGKYRYNLNYLEVPILAVFKLNRFYISGGPYAGFLLGVNITDVDNNGDIDQVESLDRDNFNTFDYGVAVGTGFDFESGTFGLRYSYGLNELGKDGSFAGEAVQNAKNSALQLFIGFDLN